MRYIWVVTCSEGYTEEGICGTVLQAHTQAMAKRGEMRGKALSSWEQVRIIEVEG